MLDSSRISAGLRRVAASQEHVRHAGQTLRRLGPYLRRERSGLFLAAMLVSTTVGVDLVGPLLLRRAIDYHVMTGQLTGLGQLALSLLALFAAAAVLNLWQSHVIARTAQRVMVEIRGRLFETLQHLPLRFFDRRMQGELMARLTSDVENVNQVLSNGVSQLVTGILTTVAVSLTMLLLHPLLGAFSVCTIAGLTLLSNRLVQSRAHARYRRQQAALGELYGFAEETIGGQKLVKSYGLEQTMTERFDRISHDYRDASIRTQNISGLTPPLMNTINHTSVTIVAAAGGLLAIRSSISIGTIATFVNYVRQFGRPLNEVANLYNSFQAALAGLERIFEIIDEPREPTADQAGPLLRIRGEVRFEDVSFAYRPETPVLRRISLHAQPGQTIALIGPTGAGKTTIVNLLTRFYEVDAGSILVDGQDLRQLPIQELRRQLGVILQDTFLFATSVRDNIRYGRLDATDAEVEEAARQANADGFIRRLPNGYETKLSERGSNLSHGQRQMLAIARAMLADPAILILDEATSSIDTRTEQLIQEAMRRLRQGRTSFVIAHRTSTIADADQILTVEDGRISRHEAKGLPTFERLARTASGAVP